MELGDKQVTVYIPATTVVITTELIDNDYDETDDPKKAALVAIKNDHMDEIADGVAMEIMKVEDLHVPKR